MAAPTTLSMGRYRVLRRLGAGGMGEVYLATAVGPDGVQKQVAIKLVRDDLLASDELTRLFVEEAKVAFVLEHPNVVRAHEMGQVEGHHFLVMEYVDGVNLADLISARQQAGAGVVPLPIALYIGAQISRGLDYAHSLEGVEGHPLGIVHRDVSPANVLISRDGQVKVADFGLAKSALRSVHSRAGVVKGKLAYMPPEQLAGEEVGVQGDLYAVGATLYELLRGENPFGPLHEVNLASRLERVQIPRLDQGEHGVDGRLADLVHSCLADAPASRPSSARELCQGLERLARELGQVATDYDLADMVRGEASEAAGGESEAHPFDRVLGLELEQVGGEGHVSTYAAVEGSAGADALMQSFSSGPLEEPKSLAAEIGTTHEDPPRRLRLTFLVPLAALTLVVILLGVKLAGRAPSPGPAAATSPAPADMASPAADELAPQVASLRVEATPAGATVSVAGKERGTSPLTLQGLPAGRALRVVVRHPGHEPYDHEVTLEPGGTLLLQPALARVARPARAGAAARRSAGHGTLSVNSEPWSVVRVDGKKVGNTPLVGHRLRVGRHRISLHNPGTGQRYSGTVTIKKGKERRLSVTLKP